MWVKSDYHGTIAKIAEIGYTGVEAAGYTNDGTFYGLSPEDFKKSIEDVGMKIISSHAGLPLENDESKIDWYAVWQWWNIAIDAHKRAGIKYLIMPWIPTPQTLEQLQAYCDYFNQIGEKCNAHGLSFGYHNHQFEYNEIDGKVMYDYMLQHTDSDKVFFQMDVYWTIEGGKNPVDYFNEYPGRFKLLHIKDKKEVGSSGTIDFENIFNHLDKAGTVYPVVEVERYSTEPLESVKISYDYLLSAPFVEKTYDKNKNTIILPKNRTTS